MKVVHENIGVLGSPTNKNKLVRSASLQSAFVGHKIV